MIGFFVNLAIVLGVVAMCIDWVDVFYRTANASSKLVHDVWYGASSMLESLMAFRRRHFLMSGYGYSGKHRAGTMRQPTDSEVDRWRGADDAFADFLHTLNIEVHMNDQARA